jgi:hypothetical protein
MIALDAVRKIDGLFDIEPVFNGLDIATGKTS